jgi:hypothetical protein
MYHHEQQMGMDGAPHELSKDTGVWASDIYMTSAGDCGRSAVSKKVEEAG